MTSNERLCMSNYRYDDCLCNEHLGEVNKIKDIKATQPTPTPYLHMGGVGGYTLEALVVGVGWGWVGVGVG